MLQKVKQHACEAAAETCDLPAAAAAAVAVGTHLGPIAQPLCRPQRICAQRHPARPQRCSVFMEGFDQCQSPCSVVAAASISAAAVAAGVMDGCGDAFSDGTGSTGGGGGRASLK